ncbi:MAG: hypothetical protein KGJ86_01525 [Chloroflexota bacterium]|nr:hypothetical protein [Chloroflexota bacterium]
MSYFSRQYLLDPAGPRFHYVWPWLILFVFMGMLATTYAYWVAEEHHKRAPITRMSRRIRSIAWSVALVGLALIGLRVGDAQLPIVQSRLVLYLLALSYAGLAAFLAYYVSVVVPRLDAAHQVAMLRRQYIPRSKRRR